MGVYQHHQKWVADFTYQRQRFKRTFDTEPDANLWERQVKLYLDAGKDVSVLLNPAQSQRLDASKGPKTLKELLKLTYERFWSGQKAEAGSLRNGQKIIDLLGSNKHPQDIGLTEIDNAIAKMRKAGNANGTVNRMLAALSRMLRFAASRGYITNSPRIERLREPVGRIRYLTDEEEALLLQHLRSQGYHNIADLVIVLVDTGLRVGEAFRLEWRDIDDERLIANGRKANNNTGIPLTTRVREVFQRRKDNLEGNGPFLSVTYDNLRRAWRRSRHLMELQDDPQFIPHALRHTFISRLIQRGVDIVTVQELAGHKTLVMTRRYAHLAPRNLVDAIRKLE